MSTNTQRIDKPRLVLRVGFAGNRTLSTDESTTITVALDGLYKALGNQLAALMSLRRKPASPSVLDYFSNEEPLLRVITGLCEGADALAVQRIERTGCLVADGVAVSEPKSCLMNGLAAHVAAIIPTDYGQYRRSRWPDFLPEFDRQSALCDWILELDGLGREGTDDPELANDRSARGYRAQGAVLLRHSDILIAAADPKAAQKAGGTLDTIEQALRLVVPVVFIDTGKATDAIYLVGPEDNFRELITDNSNYSTEALNRWVTQLVASPLLNEAEQPSKTNNTQVADASYYQHIKEYFDGNDNPLDQPERWSNWYRKHAWQCFESRFKPIKAERRDASGQVPDRSEDCVFSVRFLYSRLKRWFDGSRQKRLANGSVVPKNNGTVPAPLNTEFEHFRGHASSLNRRYSSLYRGAFLLNYMAAVMAILLATLSLALLSFQEVVYPKPDKASVAKESTQEVSSGMGLNSSLVAPVPISATTQTKQVPIADASPVYTSKPTHAGWVMPVILALALLKVSLVVFIFRNTQVANHNQWNEKTVHFRYLAEQLRAMTYLPLVGSHHATMALNTNFSSLRLKQSAMDWLFHSIVRAVNPKNTHQASPRNLSDPLTSHLTLITVNPLAGVIKVRDEWIKGQIFYHFKNAIRLERMNHFMETISRCLTMGVLALVAIDIVLIVLKLLGCIPQTVLPFVKLVTPFLIFLTALFPAMVAALSGLNSQSEYQRLAERSRLMLEILGGNRATVDQGTAIASGGRWIEADMYVQNIKRHIDNPASDEGAWTRDALLYSEALAADFANEVADWSVLYSKEMSDPG